jgi:hypothetical protein
LLPAFIENLTDVARMSVGGEVGCAVRRDRSTACWGDNYRGQIATGSDVPAERLTPGTIAGLPLGINVGGTTCGIDVYGGVFCWGDNQFGALGVDATTLTYSTRAMSVPAARGSSHLGTGLGVNCAVQDSGDLICWGDGGCQLVLGADGTSPTASPVRNPYVHDVRKVVGGIGHLCALQKDGRVRCWGGCFAETYTIGVGHVTGDGVADVGLDSVVDIDSLALHTCAVRANGDVLCWGANESGQLGDGTRTVQPTPVQVLGLQ